MGRLLVNLLQLVLSSFSLVCSRLYLIFAHMLDFMSDLGLGEGWGGGPNKSMEAFGWV